jgi:hypothetical protein
MDSSGQVLKFGGMSIGSGERIRRVASVIGHHVLDGEDIVPVIVVSASPISCCASRVSPIGCKKDVQLGKHGFAEKLQV